MDSNSDYILSYDPAPTNMAYCLVDIETEKIIKWGLFSIADNTNEGSCRKLVDRLDGLKLTDNIDVIIVHEQQPRCNAKTMTICGQLQMYYVLETLENPDSGIEKIVGHHAGHKIKYYEPKPGDEPMPMARLNKMKKGHYKNKQTVIEHCRRILKHKNEDVQWIKWFENNKKKDDLADSYVQALSYIKMHKLGKYREKSDFDYNWEELNKNNELVNMTNDQLKIYLKKYQIPQTGNKSDLIKKIKTHLNNKVL
jgi:hypothetical protein